MYDIFMLNLGLAMEVNRYACIGMVEKGWGRVVHVGSIAGGEAIGSVPYNTIKAALGAYVRSFGKEMAKHGVVVAGIAPGAFLAPGGAMERLKSNHPEAYQEFVDSRLPRNKMGEGSELIPILQLLFSEGASMMGGSMIPIDAGEGHYYS
jgi:3-oxoacyl-[acyl-carrier protein] reductase